jgi:hypothetical protein
MDTFRTDLERLLVKHGVETAIVLVNNQPEHGKVRVIALGSDSECHYAQFLEACINVSKKFRGILEHVSQHSIASLMENALLDEELLHPKNEKKPN